MCDVRRSTRADDRGRRLLRTPGPPASRWCRWCRRRNGRMPAQLPRPNSIFVTQLIATAEHVPQTRGLRRATPGRRADRLRANQHRVRAPASGPGRSSEVRISAARPATAASRCPAAVPATALPATARSARRCGLHGSGCDDLRLGMIQQHGFGDRSRRRHRRRRRGRRMPVRIGARLRPAPAVWRRAWRPPAPDATGAPRRARNAMPDRKSTSASSVSRK